MTNPNLLAQRPSWLVRFPRTHGDGVAGAGVLVGTRHVVTCAHVLDKQFGREDPEPGRSPAAPARVVEVEFPFADKDGSPGARMRATVVGWVPIAADGSGDAALLELETELDLTPNPEPAPKDKKSVAYTPAPLACPPALSGHQFSVSGFPHGNPAARQVTGVLRGASGQEGSWVQLDPEGAAGWAIEVGFSGAPVFDHSRAAVVGIVVIRDDHRTGHMIPMSYLRKLWPEVRNNCRWRLDLEASYRTHWRPRARGSEPDSRTTEWFFTGRTEARRVIRDWLEGTNAALSGHSMLLVTGGPGSGKSSLLAHSLVASDPLLSRTVPTSGPCPPIGAFDAAVYLKERTCDEVMAQLARALDVTASDSDELVAAVSEFPDGKRFTVLADAVEEAASQDEAVEIAALLRDLTNTGQVRVLAAVRTTPAGASRQKILAAFGRSTPRIDLEDSRYLHRPDVAEYVARRLASEQAASARYRAYRPDQLHAIGEKVARKARYNFLIAQLTTGWLTDPRGQQAGPDDPNWETELPETVGQAMDRYLRTCGSDTDTVKRLLTALAYARGDGLPRGAAWLRMADALAPDDEEPVRDLGKVFKSAAQHLVERVNEGSGPHTYRLFHDALDQHLRETLKLEHHAPEAAITAALSDAVPCGPDGERAWAEADAYTRDHLATHAAAGNLLDRLLDDADYLVNATPQPLLRALAHTRTPTGRALAAVYRTSAPHHATASPTERGTILAIDAARHQLTDTARALSRALPWHPRWATGNLVQPTLRATLTGHGDEVRAVAVGQIDGHPIAVTGSQDGTVRVWDLIDGTERAVLTGHTEEVRAVAVGYIDGHPIAVTGSKDGTVRACDLIDGTERAVFTGHTSWVYAVAVGQIDGRPIAISGSGGTDRTVRVWDLTDGTERAVLTGHTGDVHSVAVGYDGGRPVAVTGSDDWTVRVWDLTDGTERAVLTSHLDEVRAVAVGQIDGHPIAVTGSQDRTVRVWDLTDGTERAVLTGHTDTVRAVAIGQIDGHPIAVTGSVNSRPDNQTVHVRVWGLADGTQRTVIDGVGDRVGAMRVNLAVGQIEGHPIAVTGGYLDRTLRVWDLADGTQRAVLTSNSAVIAVAVGQIDGHPIAVTNGFWGLRVWDLAGGTERATLIGHGADVCAVAVGQIDGRPIAVSGSTDQTVQVWDLIDGTERAILTGHTDTVNAVAVGYIDGHPIAVTGSTDQTVRVWDLTLNQCIETVRLPLPCTAVATTGDTIILGAEREVIVLDRARALA